MIKRCTFIQDWMGRCKEEVAFEDSDFCQNHLGKECRVCGRQAVKSCDDTVGPFVCGVPLCERHNRH